MFCSNCGKEIDDKASVCIHCGVSTKLAPEVVDNGGFGWGILGCCIPLVGLILFLVWKDTKPKTSKAAGIGALVGVICMVLFYAAIFFFGILGAIANSGTSY